MTPLSADACVKCTICTAACPVVPVAPQFPGPKFGGPELWRLLAARADGGAALAEGGDLDACTNCQLCQLACPHGVPVAWLLAWNRQRLQRGRAVRLRDRWLGRPDRLARRLRGRDGLARRLWPLVARGLGLAGQRPLPRPQAVTFRAWFRAHRGCGGSRGPVAVFVDCQAEHFDKGPAVALVQLLERLGFDVVLPPPEPGCCGAAWISQGRPGRAVALARRGAGDLARLAEQGIPILALSSTCGPTVAREWAGLLGVAAAASLAAAVWDAADFLLERVGVAALRAALPARGGPPVAYHATCRLRGQGNGAPGARILTEAVGLQVLPVGLDCCGMGGAYGSKAERFATSVALASRAAAAITAARDRGARCVVTDSATCGWQLEMVGGLPARHPIEVLVEAGMGEVAAR